MADKYLRSLKFKADGDTYFPLPPLASNGKKWESTNLDPYRMSCIEYVNGLYVMGDRGIYYSNDGKHWIQSNISSDYRITDISYWDGLWIASSSGSHQFYSTDGKTWTIIENTTYKIQGIKHFKNVWVGFVYSNYESTGGLYYSEDGVTWSPSGINGNTIYSIIEIDDKLFTSVSGVLYTSTNGMTWTKISLSLGNCIYGGFKDSNGYIYLYGLSGIIRSMNSGRTWKNVYYRTTSNVFKQIIGKIIRIDNTLFAYSCANAQYLELYTSTNGQIWTKTGIFTNIKYPFAMSYVNDILILASKSGLWYSIDGTKWTQSNVTDDFWTDLSNNIVSKIIYNEEQKILVGFGFYSETGDDIDDGTILQVKNAKVEMVTLTNAEEVSY